jgi:uncharacterized protein
LYQPRIYRDEMNSDRFRLFSSIHRESDLMVGVSHHKYHPEMESVCRKEQLYLYELLSAHIATNPTFVTSLSPLHIPADPDMPEELKCMYKCARTTGTGPMSSVAGLFAEFVGRAIESMVSNTGDSGEDPAEDSAEIMVENGGDLYVKNRKELVVVVHAGKVALSGKLGLVIPPGEWGVCTSSGTLGHSFSRGKADAVTVVSRSTPLADAWATALANDIERAQDIEALLEKVAEIPEILACVVIAGGQMGIRGAFETKLLT